MSKYSFIIIIILIIILFIIQGSKFIEKFSDSNCIQYGTDYNLCYSNNCTIMLDDSGTPFCTSKNLYKN